MMPSTSILPRGKPLAALAAHTNIPPPNLRIQTTLTLHAKELSPDVVLDLCELVRTSPNLDSLILTDSMLTTESVTLIATAISARETGLSLIDFSGRNELDKSSESCMRVAMVRSALRRPGAPVTIVLPLETEEVPFTEVSCVAPRDGANVDDVKACAKAICKTIEGCLLEDVKLLFAELIIGIFAPPSRAAKSVATRAFLCLETGIVCRARGGELRFDDPEASKAMYTTSRAAIAALCAVLASLPRIAVDSLWGDYALVFEHAIEKRVTQVTTLPIVQDAHWRLFYGSLGAIYRRAARTHAVTTTTASVVVVCLSAVLQPIFFVVFMFLPDAHDAVCRRLVLFGRPLIWFTDPWLRLVLDRAASLLLIFLMLWMPAILGHPDYTHSAVWALLLAVGMLGTELEELLYLGIIRSPLSAVWRFFLDEWNLVDVVGLGCAVIGLPAYIAENIKAFDDHDMLPARWQRLAAYTGVDEERLQASLGHLAHPGDRLQSWHADINASSLRATMATDSCLAGAVFVLTVRHMRMLYLSRSVGPYVQMLWSMIEDVGKISCLAVPITLGFAFSMVMMFKQEPDWDMSDCTEQATSFGQTGAAIAMMLEVMIGGQEAQMSCLRESLGAWVIYFLFIITTVVLLLNMLIAAMTRTFDTVAEQSDIYAIFNLCKLAQSASRLPLVPPPFNLLGLPSRFVTELSCAVARGTLFGVHRLMETAGYGELNEDDTATTRQRDAPVHADADTTNRGRARSFAGRRWTKGEGFTLSALHADRHKRLADVIGYMEDVLMADTDSDNWRDAVARDVAVVRKRVEASETRVGAQLAELRQLMVKAPWYSKADRQNPAAAEAQGVGAGERAQTPGRAPGKLGHHGPRPLGQATPGSRGGPRGR